MATISVPVPSKLEAHLDEMVQRGVASTRAGVMRKALEMLVEEEVLASVRMAEQELKDGKGLRGDVGALLAKMP